MSDCSLCIRTINIKREKWNHDINLGKNDFLEWVSEWLLFNANRAIYHHQCGQDFLVDGSIMTISSIKQVLCNC
jgi:hypothetical protein